MTDKELLDALEVPYRVDIWCNYISTGERMWTVAGGGVQAGPFASLRDALTTWVNTLDFASEELPDQFSTWARYRKVQNAS